MKFSASMLSVVFVSMLALAITAILPVAAVAQQKGLILHFTLSEGNGDTTKDQSGNGNDGTLFGDPKWVQGKNGMGLYLDGSDDYIEISNILTPAGTIEFWFKPDWDGGDAEDYRLFDASLGGIYFFISKGADHADINPGDFGLYFEDGLILDLATGSAAAGDWMADMTVVAVDATNQRFIGTLWAGGTGTDIVTDYAADTTDTGAAGTIPLKLQVGLAHADDTITCEWWSIEYYNKAD